MGQDDAKGPQPGAEARDPIADAALTWFIALQSGTVDPGTRTAFEEWRRSDPRHADAFAKVAQVWDLAELRHASRNVAAGLHRAGAVPRAQRRAFPRARRWVAPAAVAAALLVAIGLHEYPSVMLRLRSDYITATGDQRTIILPDGSTMTLNTASAVALDFAKGRRTVRLLDGEAYFDVVHDPARPFCVINRFSAVEDVGTAFDVRTDSAADQVVLARGLVDVSRLAAPSDALRLQPGYAARASAAGLSKPAQADIAEALAWREGRYVFNAQPFGRVLDNLRRYYRGRIFVLSGSIYAVSVSGNYRLDDPLGAIRSLAHVAGASMTVLPGGIIILR